MVVKYNKNSIGTKNERKKIHWQCNVNTSVTAARSREVNATKLVHKCRAARLNATPDSVKLNCPFYCHYMYSGLGMSAVFNKRI